MEYYQAQYYNEALMHYGVKGMKWGVRKQRLKNYVKASGRVMANRYRHPIATQKAINKMNRYSSAKTVLRRSTLGYTKKEFDSINKAVSKSVAKKQLAKAAKKKSVTNKAAKKPVVKRAAGAVRDNVKASGRAMSNNYRHPIETQRVMYKMNKGKPIKTQLRRRTLGYTTKELNEFNNEVEKRTKKKKKR